MKRAAVEVVATRKRIALRNRRALCAPSKHIISGLMGEGRFYRFREPIEVRESETGGVWVHRCELLGIHAFGATRDESWEAFIDFFEADWDLVAQGKDSKLTEGAQELKQKYLGIVESVEPVL